MSNSVEIQIELTPVPPQSPAALKAEIAARVQEWLSEQNQEALITNREIIVRPEQTFPTDAVVIVVIQLVGHVAKKVYDDLIHPRLVASYGVKERKRLEE